MDFTSFDERRQIESLDRSKLARLQLEKLNRTLAELRANSEFYRRKLADCPAILDSVEQLTELPLTSKDELQPAAGDAPFAINRTYPIERYVRFHQTSGTRGRPLVVLDTADDWNWWIECWQYVLDAADITVTDRALLAFSFGPFVGFWSAFDALVARGALVMPGGGLSSLARIELIERTQATVLLCTPTYALRLAEVASDNNIDLRTSTVNKIIVAGEPGGSVPAFRERIESAWDARVIDHSGASEVGPWGYADAGGHGLYANEAEFIAEFISVESGRAAHEGELSHLILTTLGRLGAPVVRFRTGDLVRPKWNLRLAANEKSDARVRKPASSSSRLGSGVTAVNRFVLLEGGVLGRADDMMIIRGVNIFPTAVEEILHSFPEVVEYRMTARKRGEMDELVVEVEDRQMRPERIAEELRLRLGLVIEVRCVTAMSLPRFDGKGRRFVDER